MKPKPRARVLLLNASWEPLTTLSVQRAIILLLAQKAESIQNDDIEVWGSPSQAIPVPVTIRLLTYVRIPRINHVGLSRRALIARDKGLCGYCGRPGDTIDHIIPRSRGGTHDWINVTLSCRPCNSKKADKLLSELGWKLKIVPKAPQGTVWRIMNVRYTDPRWHEYLPNSGE
jgi:5-methylcytosine-specific restriction endonuclease McrA